ncbi:nucleotidyltransferase substrate binding protein [Desulfobulbus sp.]|uniref:nucleotidyltransferase substrate binding protein n=1 Tax=Desulfobulbus sp. TaxID=895 RepID=UPI00286EF271|nr:nucleotidyltransferase substrate binding protein [Desulfobulbus sp.]
MAASQDIRWKQRFQNFDRAFVLLRSALEEKRVAEFNRLEQEGLIQRFEFTYELAWKTAKDYLQEMGVVFDEVTPKAVVAAAYAAGLIKDGQLWIDMRLHRNMLSYSYDEAVFKEVLEAVEQRYLPALDALHLWLLERMAARP